MSRAGFNQTTTKAPSSKRKKVPHGTIKNAFKSKRKGKK